jgi:hypothetical protein
MERSREISFAEGTSHHLLLGTIHGSFALGRLVDCSE